MLMLLFYLLLSATEPAPGESPPGLSMEWTQAESAVRGSANEQLIVGFRLVNHSSQTYHGLVVRSWTSLGPVGPAQRIVTLVRPDEVMQRELTIDLGVGMTQVCVEVFGLISSRQPTRPQRICRPIEIRP